MSGMTDRDIILTIREYENSVEMPDGDRRTYLDPRGGVHLREGDENAQDFLGVANLFADYIRFGDEVDLATCGQYGTHDALKICDTPELLLRAGFEQRPMLYTQKHLMQALARKNGTDRHRHGLTAAQVKRFPELFASPVMLANSPARDDVLLAVLCAVDGDGLPLIAAIKPDGRGNYELSEIETNMVLSVYGKRNFGRYFNMLREPEALVYMSKKKGQELERLSKLQLLGDYSNLDLDCIIQRPQCLVNKENAGQSRDDISKEKAMRNTGTMEAHGFQPIGALEGRAEPGVGYARQTGTERFDYAFVWPEGDGVWATLTGSMDLAEQPEDFVTRVLVAGGFYSESHNTVYDPLEDFKSTCGDAWPSIWPVQLMKALLRDEVASRYEVPDHHASEKAAMVALDSFMERQASEGEMGQEYDLASESRNMTAASLALDERDGHGDPEREER